MNKIETFSTTKSRELPSRVTSFNKTAVSVRLAVRADANAIVHISRRGFADAHQQAFADSDLTRYLSNSFNWHQVTEEISAAHMLFFVAEMAGKVIGTLRVSHTSPPSPIRLPMSLELSRLYLDPQWIGWGVGAALMRYALRTALISDRKSCWLTVWEENRRAINFYQRWGFQQVGTETLPVGESCPTGLVMARWF